jgi:hypothetical protein
MATKLPHDGRWATSSSNEYIKYIIAIQYSRLMQWMSIKIGQLQDIKNKAIHMSHGLGNRLTNVGEGVSFKHRLLSTI